MAHDKEAVAERSPDGFKNGVFVKTFHIHGDSYTKNAEANRDEVRNEAQRNGVTLTKDAKEVKSEVEEDGVTVHSQWEAPGVLTSELS